MPDLPIYALALAIGFLLGLLGGGGSILTVPVLVYVAGLDPVAATAYSLFVVGATSLMGAGAYYRRGLVDLRLAGVFALPSVLTIFFIRRAVLPHLPDPLLVLGQVAVGKNLFLMLLFATLMLATAWRMLRGGGATYHEPPPPGLRLDYPLVLGQGLATGLLAGLVGAGGGFLIVPALNLLARLPMRMAVGTSLAIIALNSLLGFAADLASGQQFDWPLLLGFAGVGGAGVLLGIGAGHRVPPARLRHWFGWLVLAVAAYVVGRELLGAVG
ncbi:MAG: sulfite exporter TauE/SafE family protein [Bernardetiaceae bacterium]|jgi:hypothetical protein|nr:sulfite exporter TauE/SafE family protein [Bernardetiaceae bacterium]